MNIHLNLYFVIFYYCCYRPSCDNLDKVGEEDVIGMEAEEAVRMRPRRPLRPSLAYIKNRMRRRRRMPNTIWCPNPGYWTWHQGMLETAVGVEARSELLSSMAGVQLPTSHG